MQRGDQADRESIHTQDERLRELDSNYSLIMEKEDFKLTYPSGIKSSLRRMNVDKTLVIMRRIGLGLHSETREKSISRHKTGVRSKDGDRQPFPEQ